MTKLDKEIQEGLYDPKAAISQITAKEWNTKKKHGYTLVKNGQKYILAMLKGKTVLEPVRVLDSSKQRQFEKQCRAKAHEGKKLKGQQKLTSAVSTSKRLSEFAFDIKGIADSLRRQGIEPDLIDIEGEYDHNLSHSENLAHFKDMLGLGGRRKQGEYEAMAEQFYKAQTMGIGKLAMASPQERAAAFARMRETGTLRGYDLKGAGVYIITDSKGNKHKATYAQWLKWMKEQKRPYDPMTGTQKEIMAKLKSYGLSNKEAIYYINHPSKLKAEDLIRIGKQRRVFYDPKKKETLSETIMRTSLKDLERWEKDFDYGLFETLTEGAKWKLRFAWGYPEGMTPRKYDPKPSVPPTRWYEAMVKGIKKSSDVRNPYAIVKSIWAKLSPSKRSEIKAREKKGEKFRYDLPLPVDKPTRGTGTVRMVKPFKLAEVQVNLSVKDYLTARASGLFQKMKRQDGTTALVARCKSPASNVNVFVDKV